MTLYVMLVKVSAATVLKHSIGDDRAQERTEQRFNKLRLSRVTTLCLCQMLAVMHSCAVGQLTEDSDEEEILPFSVCFGVVVCK